MEQRQISGKNHWYHETQSSLCPVDVLPLVPEAADADHFLLDLSLNSEQLNQDHGCTCCEYHAAARTRHRHAPAHPE